MFVIDHSVITETVSLIIGGASACLNNCVTINKYLNLIVKLICITKHCCSGTMQPYLANYLSFSVSLSSSLLVLKLAHILLCRAWQIQTSHSLTCLCNSTGRGRRGEFHRFDDCRGSRLGGGGNRGLRGSLLLGCEEGGGLCWLNDWLGYGCNQLFPCVVEGTVSDSVFFHHFITSYFTQRTRISYNLASWQSCSLEHSHDLLLQTSVSLNFIKWLQITVQPDIHSHNN